MTETAFVDLSPYSRPVRLSVTTGIMLPRRLIKAAPASLSPRAHAALMRVRTRSAALQTALAERQRSYDLRPYDRRFDGAWAGLHGRIHAHTRVLDNPDRDRAQRLLERLFPAGLAFLTGAYEDEWVYASAILERIETDGLVAEVEAFASPKFLAWARAATQTLANALGVGEGGPEPAPTIGPLLVAIAQAIANYGRIYSGELELDDPKAVAAFRAAMAPIDAHRNRPRRTIVADGAEADEPEDLLGPGAEEEADEQPELLEAPLPELPPLD